MILMVFLREGKKNPLPQFHKQRKRKNMHAHKKRAGLPGWGYHNAREIGRDRLDTLQPGSAISPSFSNAQHNTTQAPPLSPASPPPASYFRKKEVLTPPTSLGLICLQTFSLRGDRPSPKLTPTKLPLLFRFLHIFTRLVRRASFMNLSRADGC